MADLGVLRAAVNVLQGDFLGGGHGHGGGADLAGVADVGGEEDDEVGGRDRAFIDDRGGGVALEDILAGEEVGVADVEGRGDQGGGVDPRVLPEVDAVLVDQVHNAGSVEQAVNDRGIGADDP